MHEKQLSHTVHTGMHLMLPVPTRLKSWAAADIYVGGGDKEQRYLKNKWQYF